MKRVLIKIILAALALIVVAVVAFFIWALWIPKPMPEALATLTSDESVSIGLDPWLTARPANRDKRIGLIIYPGARVDPRAYAPLARSLATSGITVIIPSMPLNLAIFGPDRASDILARTPGIDRWFIAGHSLGGSMAADFASKNGNRISGLVLLASYPRPGSSLLTASDLRVLSIYGSSDQIATITEVLESKADLPKSTVWIEIPGGNHSQFGWYGDQSGDGEAHISREEQQRLIIHSIRDFIERG